MDPTKRYKLSFRNIEVRVYTAIVLPAVLLGLTIFFL